MSLTPEEIATMKSTPADFEQLAHASFNASVTQHLTRLDEASLKRLPDHGALLIDESMILSLDFSCEAVFVFEPGHFMTTEEHRRCNFPRFTPYPVFNGLRDFALIQRHILRLPQDGRTWDDLTHSECLRVAIAYLAIVTPLELYMSQLRQRSRQQLHRGNRPAPLAKPRRGPTH